MYSARASTCDLLLHYPHSWSDGSKATEHIFFHNFLIDNTNSFTQGWKDAPFVPSGYRGTSASGTPGSLFHVVTASLTFQPAAYTGPSPGPISTASRDGNLSAASSSRHRLTATTLLFLSLATLLPSSHQDHAAAAWATQALVRCANCQARVHCHLPHLTRRGPDSLSNNRSATCRPR